MPWAADVRRPAETPKLARDELGHLRLFHRPDVDEPSSSEATFFRDPRVEQILKDQARYDYVLRTYIKYL